MRGGRLRTALGTPHGLLVIVCLLHAVLATGFVVLHHMWWEQDETVYLSQVARHAPALQFTPPRARGMPVLLFPAAQLTSSVTVLRSWLVLIGTVGLYVGFRPWLRLVGGWAVPLAALLVSSLWTATFFGAEAQPNFVVAVVAVASTGWAVLALRSQHRRGALLATALWLALLALVRPSDATWLAAGLAAVAIAARGVPRRSRLLLLAALGAGLVLGWSEWVVEAFASYGGPLHRLHEANAENTPGLHFSLLDQARAANGPTLCRPCSGETVELPAVAWWVAVPPLVAAGVLWRRRSPELLALLAATLGGVALLAEYLFTIDYGAPRFLLPAYALLSLPVAVGLLELLSRAPGPRRLVVAVAVAAFLANAVEQTVLLRGLVGHIAGRRAEYVAVAQRLTALGVSRPCVVYGVFGPPVAFAMGCNDHPVGPALLARVPTGTTAVMVLPTRVPRGSQPPDVAGWHRVVLHGGRIRRHWTAYVLLGGRPARGQ